VIGSLLSKIKKNLILEHNEDDNLIELFIATATAYAENYQHKIDGYYQENKMSLVTEQAIILLVSHFYESRDGSTGGFFADNTNAAAHIWTTVNMLLRLDRDWKV